MKGAQQSVQPAARKQRAAMKSPCGSGFPAAILRIDDVAFVILLTAYRSRLTHHD